MFHLRCFLTLCWVLLMCFSVVHAQQRAYADYSGWDGTKPSVRKLTGPWELYYNQLLAPGDFDWRTQPDRLMNLPGYFADYGFDNQGVATLRMEVKTDGIPQGLTLYLNDVLSAYKVWVDGRLMGEVGTVSSDPVLFRPGYRAQVFNFPSTGVKQEIVIQIANFSHNLGGSFTPIYIGTPENIMKTRLGILSIRMFLLGALLVMGCFNLILFGVRKKEFDSLYLGLFSFILAIRTVFSGEKMITYAFPEIDWGLMYRCDLLTFYLGVPIFLEFIRLIFHQVANKVIIRVIQVYAVVLSLIVIFAPVAFSLKYTLFLAQISTLLTVFYVLWITYKAYQYRLFGAKTFALGNFILALGTVNDILFFMGIISTFEISSFTLIIYILIQSFLLYNRFHSTFEKNLLLTAELSNQNQLLEQKIEERTKDIIKVNSELRERQKALIEVQESLERSTFEILEQQRVSEEKNRNIQQSISYAWRIQHALLPKSEKLNQAFGANFTLWRPKTTVSGDFYWLRQTEGGIRLAVGNSHQTGVPGALVSMLTVALLNESTRVFPREYQITALLSGLNEQIIRMLDQSGEQASQLDGVNIGYFHFDLLGGKSRFCGVQQSAYVLRSKSAPPFEAGEGLELIPNESVRILKLSAAQQSLGHPQAMAGQSDTAFLPLSGDRFYAFTEGVVRQQGGKPRAPLSEERMLEWLVMAQGLPMSGQAAFIDQKFTNWKGKREMTGDALILGFEWEKT